MNASSTAIDVDRVAPPEVHDVPGKIDPLLQEVMECVAPVWPLKDYVAVNPYFGLASRSFMSARTFLRVFSDCETLMPLEYYADQWRAGQLEVADVEQALAETDCPHSIPPITAQQIFKTLRKTNTKSHTISAKAEPNSTRSIRTLVEHAAKISSMNWSEIVTGEISKFCSAHYDDGQASWGSAWQDRSLYTAWHAMAQVDRNAEILGLKKIRQTVSSLPQTPKAAIVELLSRMRIPYSLWSTVLLGQVYSMPGWFAWTRYQDQQSANGDQSEHFVGLLAIRLAYDLAVGETLGLEVDWHSYLRNGYASFEGEQGSQLEQAWMRYILQQATEIRYRRNLLAALPPQAPTKPAATSAQMVFCIDVRSERIRRHLESHLPSVETFGFAGFFGLPIAFLPLGESEPTTQLPALLKHQHCVRECLADASPESHQTIQQRRQEIRWWRKLWQSFKASSLSSFGFVESSGLLASWQLIRQSLGWYQPVNHQADGVRDPGQLRPAIDGDQLNEMSLQDRIEIVGRALSNLGLTKNYARLVVFCGHHSQTNNNPLAAGLDCGACGGHSGEPNARLLALALNQTDVRLGLGERGIVIPAETHFLAATHNTTTDIIEFFDTDRLPASHQADFDQLQAACHDASATAAAERLPTLSATRPQDIIRRAADWSEVRPEWGLAGNVAFVAGPRWLTRNLDLNGQVFLHSYDSALDPQGNILETIMTAPMIVANWINMQYYASTVDNHHFGSGSKVIHNVVGKFGILAGNSGDLQTGLPLQSVHDGHQYRHLPMRLTVVICANRTSIDRIYQKHELVANLINNQWLHLIAVEGSEHYRLCPNGQWDQCMVTSPGAAGGGRVER